MEHPIYCDHNIELLERAFSTSGKSNSNSPGSSDSEPEYEEIKHSKSLPQKTHQANLDLYKRLRERKFSLMRSFVNDDPDESRNMSSPFAGYTRISLVQPKPKSTSAFLSCRDNLLFLLSLF